MENVISQVETPVVTPEELKTKQVDATGAIATSKNYYGMAEELLKTNPDKVLSENPSITLATYRNLLVDPHLSSCIQSRNSGILAMDWDINLGNEKDEYATFAYKVLKSLDIRQILGDILDSVQYGFKPLEIIWQYDGEYLLPSAVIGKPSWWFQFDNTNNLRFMIMGSTYGEVVPPNKFLIPVHNPTYDNPYGEALLGKCFYPIVYKKGAMKLWAEYIQKYGSPFLLGKLFTGKGADKGLELLGVLQKIAQGGSGVVGQDDTVEMLDGSSAGSSVVFDMFIHTQNSEMSKIELSQTLTTEQGETGSYAMSKTHLQVRKDVVDADKVLCEYWINELIKIVINMNFPNITTYPKFELWADADVDAILADRDSKLAATNQIRFTKTYFQNAYGFKDDEIEIVENPAPVAQTNPFGSGGMFSEPAFDMSEMDLMSQAVLKPIFDMIRKGTDFSEMQAKLIELFPKLDITDLENYLAEGITIATASGRLDGIHNHKH